MIFGSARSIESTKLSVYDLNSGRQLRRRERKMRHPSGRDLLATPVPV